MVYETLMSLIVIIVVDYALTGGFQIPLVVDSVSIVLSVRVKFRFLSALFQILLLDNEVKWSYITIVLGHINLQ